VLYVTKPAFSFDIGYLKAVFERGGRCVLG
jgi:hypothetical protein